VLLRSGSQLGISTNQVSARAVEVVRGCYTVRSVVAVGTDCWACRAPCRAWQGQPVPTTRRRRPSSESRG